MTVDLTLTDLRTCFEGAVPAVVATASSDGTPNVTYLSRVQLVDDERVALSNQFFSKTARNLAENPRASILLIEPATYAECRLSVVFERTERRGPVFDRLREDIDALAVVAGMQDVFKLRAADIYRVVEIEHIGGPTPVGRATAGPGPEKVAEHVARLSRCADLDTLLDVTVDGLAELFGYEHTLVLLLDEDGRRLYTIASQGYAAEGVGSEVLVGEGLIGLAAQRCAPMRIGSIREVEKYSRIVRRSYEDSGEVEHREPEPIALPGLPDAESRVAVPAMAYGQLVGVLVAESRDVVAFSAVDEAVLSVVAAQVAQAVERERERSDDERPAAPATTTTSADDGPATHLRFFEADGSTFLDGDYLIKGVAGRILWLIAGQHAADGRVDFSHRELRLNPALDLPAFRDNLENRVILLKRRLDERDAPLRLEKTGRGLFRLHATHPLRLDLGP